MLSVQRRFTPPQRQAFGLGCGGGEDCDCHWHSEKSHNKSENNGSSFPGLSVLVLLGLGTLMATQLKSCQSSGLSAANRDAQLVPIIDSLSNHKINAGNIDSFVSQRAIDAAKKIK